MAAIDDITNLYVGYFNRAPDPAGLNFWVAQRAAGASLDGIANSFSLTSEAQALYGFLAAPLVGSPSSFLAGVYTNLFGRTDLTGAADVAGLAYWTAQLANPALSVGRIIVDIISGAQGNDALVVANKAAVGKFFVQSLVNQNLGFNAAALATAKTAFNGVTSDAATVTTANAAVTAAFSATGTVGGIASNTFNLTAGVDSFVGGPGADIFNGVVNSTGVGAGATFTSVDSLDGGAGAGDVLNALIEGGTAFFPNGPINNIEIFNVRNLSTVLQTINFGAIGGETAVNFDRGTGATTAVNLAAGTTVGLIGDGLTALGASIFGFAVPTSPVTLNISGGTAAGTGAVDVTNGGATAPSAVTVNSTGATNNIGALTVGGTALTVNAASALLTGGLAGGAALQTITISGAAVNVPISATTISTGAVTLGTASASVTTIDASGLTAGGVRIGLGAGVTSFKGGAGNDVVNTAALSGSAVIDAGANSPLAANGFGGDFLVVLSTTHVDTAAKAQQYKGFEGLTAVTGVTVKVDDFINSTISGLAAAGDNIVFNAVSQAQAKAVLIAASAATNITFNVTGAGVSGSDVLGIGINDLGNAAVAPVTITLGNITAPNVETINFLLTDNLTVDNLTGATGLTTMGFFGTGNLSLTTGALALTSNSTTINASALGGLPGGTVLINASGATGFGVSITGSSTYANTLTGTALADTLVGGAGKDFLANRGAGTATAADLMTGGAGQDTFQLFGDVASGAVPATYNLASRISDFTVTTSSVTTDILALSETFGNYGGASALQGTVAIAGAGTTVVQSVAQNAAAAAFTAGLDLIKLSTGIVTTGLTVQTAFNTAIGTGSVTGLTAGAEIFGTYYDITNSRAVVILINPGDADTVVDTADVVSLIGTINMSAADYATFGAAQLQIVA